MTPLKNISNGLILRRGRSEDAEALAEFNAKWLGDDGPDEPEEALAIWTRDLFTRPHPTFTPDLTTIVEDSNTGEIVSSTVLFPQTWTYEGIPFGVGRPELVATHPDYRRRGLVRLQMETIHEWSAGMGHDMQVITGIPWFYRQFGYEMALDLDGGRTGYASLIPELKKDEAESYLFRPAIKSDIPFLKTTYEAMCARHLIACRFDDEVWKYAIDGQSPGSVPRREVSIVTHPDGTPAAFFTHPGKLWDKAITMNYFAAAPGEKWLDLTPSLLRHLFKIGKSYEEGEGKPRCEEIYCQLGLEHPLFELLPNSFPRVSKPYAWYIRVPDLPGFLKKITPVLEERLAGSAISGYSGKVTLGFYNDGLKLVLKDGKFEKIERWEPGPSRSGKVRFPDLSFLSMLCGRRSFEELDEFYADCFATKDEYRALMTALFPKKGSNVWGVE